MPDRRLSYYLAACIAVATFVVYLPALRNGFVNWDDAVYVYDNVHIRTLDLRLVSWAFSDYLKTGNWHPLTWLSHAADVAVWGADPRGHHLTSVVLHAVNALLVTLLIIRLITITDRIRTDSGNPPLFSVRCGLIAAGVTGMLFGLHPLHVENVAWISERKDLLSSLFFLLSLQAYLVYADASARRVVQTRVWGSRSYLLSLVYFMLALLSKPMAVTLPMVLLLLDWYPLQRIRSWRQTVPMAAEKLPFFLLSALLSVVTLVAQKRAGGTEGLSIVGLPDRILVAIKSLAAYLVSMVAPRDLLPFYPYPETVSWSLPAYLAAVLTVIALSVAAAVTREKHPFYLAAWGYYVVTLAPVIGIIQAGGQAMADRYTYLPSIAPLLLVGLLAGRIWTKQEARGQRGTSRAIIAVVLAIALCSVLITRTREQIALWKDSVTLWSYVIEKGGGTVALPYNNRGLAFQDRREPGRAMEDFNAAIAIDPLYSYAYMNRGWVYRDLGSYREAIDDYDRALGLDPRKYAPLAYMRRGVLRGETGQHTLALADFTEAIRRLPDYADAYTGRGLVLTEMGQFDRALEDLQRAIELDPANSDAYLNRGVAHERSGRTDRAVADYSKAIELNPTDALAYRNRGSVLGMTGRLAEAIEDLTKALSLDPRLAGVYLDRGNLYRRAGKAALAAGDFQRACGSGIKDACAAGKGAGPGQ
jgi:protein O-mannosyl-transferase